MMSYPIRNGQNDGICSSVLVFISQAIHYNTIHGICYHRSFTCATVGSITECVTEWISVKVAIVNILCHVYMFINSVKVDK
jgi:hypothetical protein